MSSFVASMPVSGCFSRSSLNFESNAATQAGNLITASLVLVSALCLAEYFRLEFHSRTIMLNINQIDVFS